MKINGDRLTSETKRLEQILGRKQFKRGYENEFQNVAMYDQILYAIGATPTYAADKIYTTQQIEYINKMMDRGLYELCDFYNHNRESNLVTSLGLEPRTLTLRTDSKTRTCDFINQT